MVKRLVNFDVSFPCQREVEIPDDIANSSSDHGLRWAQKSIEYENPFDLLKGNTVDDPYSECSVDNFEFADAHEFESEPDDEDWLDEDDYARHQVADPNDDIAFADSDGSGADEDWSAGEDHDLLSRDMDSDDPPDVDGPGF